MSEPRQEPNPIQDTVVPDIPARPGGLDSSIASDAETLAQIGMIATETIGPHQATVPGYEILRELGRGGMGVVYQARQEGLNRLVALKMILHGAHANEELIERFRSEAQAIAKLRHPNVVQVYAVGLHDGLPFFALEYCSGGSLSEKFAKGRMPVNDAVDLLILLARAMQAAHEAGIVHRDLKPGNVLVDADGSPKVTDFGLAKQLDDDSNLTATGAVMGTPSYMAPEQAFGNIELIGPPSDVYALGAMLFEALTGRPPFKGAAVLDVLDMVRTKEAPPVRSLRREVPRDLEDIILQCLEKDPARRYPTGRELAEDLERWRRGDPVQAKKRGLWYRLGKKLRRHRLRLATGVLGVGLVIAGWIALADAGFPIPAGGSLQRWLDAREMSLFRPAPTKAQINAVAGKQHQALVKHLLDARIGTSGWVRKDGKQIADDSDGWTQLQVTAAVLMSAATSDQPAATPEALLPCVRILTEPLFVQSEVCDAFVPGFGWPNFNDGEPSNEASAWALSAYAWALRKSNPWPPEVREQLEQRLNQILKPLEEECLVLDAKGQPTGGWTIFVHQTDRQSANMFISTLVTQGLLSMRDCNVGWRGSDIRRDELLSKSLQWFVREFDGRGWRTPGQQHDELNDGLTLQIFGALLRAEQDRLVVLTPEILEQIPLHLADCDRRPIDHPIATAMFLESFTTPQGKLIRRAQRPVRMLWYPWAIETAARWLHRCERVGAPTDEIVRTRRVLGHLVLNLSDDAVHEAESGYTYVTAETVFGFGAVNDR